ncbi:MAG: spore coat associated protein CotJA [Thermoactinomyces sp.]
MSKSKHTPNPYKHQNRVWYPYISPEDPCKPIRKKTYVVPPNQYLGFQPTNLPQFPPNKALKHGTLWPILYSPYHKPKFHKGDD